MSKTIYSRFLKFFSGNLILTLTNIIRDTTIAAAFGTALVADNFFLAISVPVFLITVSGNACRNVFVPLLLQFSDKEANTFQDYAKRIAFVTSKTLLQATALVSLAAIIYYKLNSRGDNDAAMSTGAIFLAILPMYLFGGLIELNQGLLQSCGAYFIPSLLRLGLPIGTIIGCILLHEKMGVYSLALGGLIGALFFSMVLFFFLHQKNILPLRPTKPIPKEISIGIRKNLFALILATLIAYINPVVNQWMAAALGAGAVSTIGYASRLAVGIASLIIGSISPVVLDYFSRGAANHTSQKLATTYQDFFILAPWIGGVMTLACWSFSNIAVIYLYKHGSFDQASADAVTTAINFYALQYPFLLAGTISSNLISALSLNGFFIRLGVLMFLSNIAANYLLMKMLGINGIALSTAITYLISFSAMNFYLIRTGKITIEAKSIIKITIPILILTVFGYIFSLFKISIQSISDLRGIAAAFFLIFSYIAILLFLNKKIIRKYVFSKKG